MSFDQEIIEQLKLSKAVIGEVHAMVVDWDGDVLSGQHRKQAGWQKVHKVDTRDLAKKWNVTPLMAKDMVRLHLNIQRKPSREETQALFIELAKELEKEGIPKENIASELTKIVPYSQRWIEMLLPLEYKKIEKVKAGKLGAEVLRQKPLVECGRCMMASREATEYKGMMLCPSCLEKAKRKPVKIKFPELPSEPPTVKEYKPKETWEHRKAVMHPQHSKMEDELLLKFEASDVHPITDKEFCLQATTPDFYFPQQNLAVYVDGPVHAGKEDRDDVRRELLSKRHHVRVLSLKYDNYSKAEEDRLFKQIMTKIS